MDFKKQPLQRAGFIGWLGFDQIRAANPCPTGPGVYVVTHAEGDPVRFGATSCGGWFKGKDPTVTMDAITSNWVEGAEVVYIGMASSLRRRLREFAAFGSGKPVGHWGGRLIWQLGNPAALRIAWKETPDDEPRTVEAGLIADFLAVHGKPPFANNPHLLGN